ncbi:MAG TPA: FAD-dependent monooxygenase [Xanthobacteraceae bacterium]|nr:FAD-dependent monooxygenase [Xanthobacteraceae bacterium]
MGPVIIAGAGIGGLTAALAIARRGHPVIVFEQAPHLEEVGAGIQLSPNASRILIGLGLGDALQRHVVAPEELRVMNAQSAQVLARAPLGAAAQKRYGAPYWVIHRGDLQAVLTEAVRAHPDITLHLGARIEDFALHRNGVTVAALAAQRAIEERGHALIAADGLWSKLRARLGHRDAPRFARHTAWRALAPADELIADLRAPAVNLWLGRDAHLVHYPVRGGSLINVVAIIRDNWREEGWNEPGQRADILARFAPERWPKAARVLLAAPQRWHKWALYDRRPIPHWGKGTATLLGDAAHPMLPYLAQGAAMAIEDAAVLAQRLADTPEDPAGAMRRYERLRRARTARAQRAARHNGRAYHMGGAGAVLRTLALLAMGGQRLIARYDWLYGWTPV